jgi:hypothetical protein
MDFGKIVNSSFDPGSYIKEELEQGLGPILKRVDALEKKLDLLILALGRIESLLKTLQPLAKLVDKIPFLK